MNIRVKSIYISSIASLFIFIQACQGPTTDAAVSTMEKYWEYYKDEKYDSLRTFYSLRAYPYEKLNPVIYAMRDLHEKYGFVQTIHLSVKEISDDGNSIRLLYEVKFATKSIANVFSFKKNGKGEYKIKEHLMGQ